MKTILKAVLGAGLASVLTAQSEDVLRQRKMSAAAVAADEVKGAAVRATRQTIEFVAGQLVSGPPVKGAPYSAEAVNETVQVLADGNRIVQRSSAMQYRDAEGRERREETSAMEAVFITDPVAGVRYTLHPESKTAEKGPVSVFTLSQNGARDVYFYSNAGESGIAGAARGPAGPGGRSGGPGTVAITSRIAEGRGGPPQEFSMVTAGGIANWSAGSKFSEPKTEELGKMFVEGVEAQGTRTTITIPAGEIGNDRPIDIVDERWYSPDLQMTVMTKHADPRSGETNFQLSKINRTSPPPYLFELPSDYTVTGGGARGGRSGGPAPASIQLNGVPMRK